MKHLPNALSYLKKGLRDVNDVMEHYNNMGSTFGSKEVGKTDDSIARDSVFQNEEIELYLSGFHHVNLPYGRQKETTLQFGPKKVSVKRKDSIIIIKKYDKKRDSLKTVYGVKD